MSDAIQRLWQNRFAQLVWMCAAGVAVFAIFVVMQASSGTSRGELGGVIAFAYFIGLISLAGIAALIGLWIWFAHLKRVRLLGYGCVALIGIVAGGVWASDQWRAHKDRQEARVVGAYLDDIGARYIERLAREDPLPGDAIAMYNAFLQEVHDAPYHRLPVSTQDRAFRARWFLYFWTFYDPKFEGFTTYYPRLEDCTFFFETFGDRYARIAPAPIFEELCTNRWNADGSEKG